MKECRALKGVLPWCGVGSNLPCAMKRLLLVDDDTVVIRSYRDRLSAHGFKVNTAGDGAAAIAILRAARPDLVVLDLMMPNLSGVDVLKFIRSESRLASTPVIVLTNGYMNDLGRQAAAIGIDRAILKSQCNPSVLMSVIDEILASKETVVEPPLLPDGTASKGILATEAAPTPPPARPHAPSLARGGAGESSPSRQASLPQGQAFGDTQIRTRTGQELLTQASGICTDLRKLFQAFAREPGKESKQQSALQEFYRKVHDLTATAGLTDYAQIAQVTDVFEALLYVLMEQPERVGPSVLRTIANLVDLLEQLFQHARESRKIPALSGQILVVDDDPLSNRLVVSGLRQAQLRARSTEDPAMAWQWLQSGQFGAYDLIILDIEMPGLNGFELCQRLRKLPGYAKTPVIYVTSHSDFEYRAKSTLSGGDDLIGKPILPMELAAKVIMHLIRRQLPS